MINEGDRKEHLITNVDVIILEKDKKKSYLPKGWSLTWWYVLIGVFADLKPKDIEIFCFLAANTKNKNIARVSKQRMIKEINCPLNHLDTRLKRLREIEAIRELPGIGYQISPHLIWCGKSEHYQEVVDEWEEHHEALKNAKIEEN